MSLALTFLARVRIIPSEVVVRTTRNLWPR